MDEEQSIFQDAQMRTTPPSPIANAFEEFCKFLRSQSKGQELRLDTFCEACSLVSILFSYLDLAFKFAEQEYVAKVRDLLEASKGFENLENILDEDVANDTQLKHQGIIHVICVGEPSSKEAASTAYGQVCAPYRSQAVRTAVYAGMCTLPCRDQILLRLKTKPIIQQRRK